MATKCIVQFTWAKIHGPCRSSRAGMHGLAAVGGMQYTAWLYRIRPLPVWFVIKLGRYNARPELTRAINIVEPPHGDIQEITGSATKARQGRVLHAVWLYM